MATYSHSAVMKHINEWLDNENDVSDLSDGSDPSSDEEDELEVQNVQQSDEDIDIAGDAHDDDDTDLYSVDEHEPVDTVLDVINSVASGSGFIEENTSGLYSSRDGNVWSDTAPFQGRRRACDVVRVQSGPKNHAVPQKVDDAVFLFCDEEFMNIIVQSTNKEMTDVYTGLNKLDDLHLLDMAEAKAFLGLLILIGVLKGRREPLEQLWDDKWGRPVFRATMGINRFKTILRHIRFDDKATRTQRRATDKLAAIRSLFEHFAASCRKYYELSSFTTIDEQLSPFRGKCPFRMYIKSKPAKYGIKLWILCDNETAYCGNAQVCTEYIYFMHTCGSQSIPHILISFL